MKLLAIDIGNSSAKAVPYEFHAARADHGKSIAQVGELKLINESNLVEQTAGFDHVAIASVVRSTQNSFVERLRKDHASTEVTVLHAEDFGLSLQVENPRSVGVDRVAAVAAASQMAGGPVVVIDFGTAITIDIGDPATFLGGLILPGPQMMFRAMANQTDALPLLHWTNADATAIRSGRSTEEAMRGGVAAYLRHGVGGAVTDLIGELSSMCGISADQIGIYRTGGASLALPSHRSAFVPELTHAGIAGAALRRVKSLRPG